MNIGAQIHVLYLIIVRELHLGFFNFVLISEVNARFAHDPSDDSYGQMANLRK